MSDDIFEGRGTDADNTAKRVPVALCLDTSGSMKKDIGDLNRAVCLFYEQCKQDARAKNAVEVIAIEFGGEVQVASSFSEVEYAQIPHFSARGGTPLGKAVHSALDALEQRKEWYKDEGISYYQPLLVLMTDGRPGDGIVKAQRRAVDMIRNRKLSVLPLAFSSKAKMEVIEGFSDGQKAIHIKQGFSFIEFFKWLSASASAMAMGGSIDFSEFQKNWDSI